MTYDSFTVFPSLSWDAWIKRITTEERTLLKMNSFLISKSRFYTLSSYLFLPEVCETVNLNRSFHLIFDSQEPSFSLKYLNYLLIS